MAELEGALLRGVGCVLCLMHCEAEAFLQQGAAAAAEQSSGSFLWFASEPQLFCIALKLRHRQIASPSRFVVSSTLLLLLLLLLSNSSRSPLVVL